MTKPMLAVSTPPHVHIVCPYCKTQRYKFEKCREYEIRCDYCGEKFKAVIKGKNQDSDEKST